MATLGTYTAIPGGAVAGAHSLSVDAAIAFWKAFDLDAKRVQLTAAADEMASKAEGSLSARRTLMDALKTFRSSPDDVKLAGFPALLKSLTDEVDALNKRARSAEKAFVVLFKELMEAPDPVPPLAALTDAQRARAAAAEEIAKLRAELANARANASGSADAAAENRKLRQEVEELEEELSKLRNQDITIRELERRIEEFESAVEAQVATRMAQQESELRRVFEQELESVREAETASEARVVVLQRALAAAEAARDEAHASLYAMQSRQGASSGLSTDASDGDATAARRIAAEADALASENAKLAAQVTALETECTELKRHLLASADLPTGTGSASAGIMDPFAAVRAQCEAYRSRAEAAERELNAALSTASQLQDEASKWGRMLEEQRAAHEINIAQLQRAVESAREEAATARADAMRRPADTELQSLKAQLAALQEAAFGGHISVEPVGLRGGLVASASADDLLPSADDTRSGGTGDVADLQSMLVKRLRHLEGRALRAEAAAATLEKEKTDIAAQHANATAMVAELTTKVAQLEDTLASRFGLELAEASSTGAATSGRAVARAATPPAQIRRAGVSVTSSNMLSPDAQLSAILDVGAPVQTVSSQADVATSAASTAPSVTERARSGDQDTMLSVLQSQRDRFRARMVEQEAQLQKLTAELMDARTRQETLLADNVKLYEKVRYLQSFLNAGGAAARPGSAGAGGAAAGDIESGAAGAAQQQRDLRARGPHAGATVPGESSLSTEEDFEVKYKKMYDASLDPFSDFSRREKAKQYGRLTAPERITLSFTQVFMSNKYSRQFVFFYVIILHLLVFATLWHFVHVSHDGLGAEGADHVRDMQSRVSSRFGPAQLHNADGSPP